MIEKILEHQLIIYANRRNPWDETGLFLQISSAPVDYEKLDG